MTRRDYLSIGQAIRSVNQDPAKAWGIGGIKYLDILDDTLLKVAERIADVFQADNPQFDRTRFLRYVKTGKDER